MDEERQQRDGDDLHAAHMAILRLRRALREHHDPGLPYVGTTVTDRSDAGLAAVCESCRQALGEPS